MAGIEVWVDDEPRRCASQQTPVKHERRRRSLTITIAPTVALDGIHLHGVYPRLSSVIGVVFSGSCYRRLHLTLPPFTYFHFFFILKIVYNQHTS